LEIQGRGSWKSRGEGEKLIENPREGVLNDFQNTVRGSPISMIVKE
jgi:Zn-finger nucleic acid-binding protein